MLSIDQGPGIQRRSLTFEESLPHLRRGLGEGLASVHRLADTFDVYTGTK